MIFFLFNFSSLLAVDKDRRKDFMSVMISEYGFFIRNEIKSIGYEYSSAEKCVAIGVEKWALPKGMFVAEKVYEMANLLKTKLFLGSLRS